MAGMKNSAYYNAIREKARTLRDIYGGMMTMTDLTHELGYGSKKSARAWVASVELEGTRIGRSIKYDTDLVAKALVAGRGMC